VLPPLLVGTSHETCAPSAVTPLTVTLRGALGTVVVVVNVVAPDPAAE
jgi:hypothetical protein